MPVDDWYRGVAVTLRYDGSDLTIVANNGKVPPLALRASAFVSANDEQGKLVLVGGFGTDTKIALKLPPADVQGIARAISERLQLPRSPQPITIADIGMLPHGTYVTISGRVFPYSNHPVMDNRLRLLGVTMRIEHNDPYRVTGWLRGEELDVLRIEHLNPPVVWFTGETVRATWIPAREILAFSAITPHIFIEPGGTHELLVPPATLAFVALDGDGLVFEGDFSRTNYGTRVKLAPLSTPDMRAIFELLDERFQIPRTPRVIAPADVASIAEATLVQIDGTFQMGHFEGPNFDGGIQLQDKGDLAPGTRLRVVGFLYPATRFDDPHMPRPLGYTGPRLRPLSIQRL